MRLAGKAARASIETPPARKAAPRTTKKGKTPAAAWRVTGFRGNLLTSKHAFFALERAETPEQPAGTAGTPFGQPLDSWSVKFRQGGPTYVQLVQPDRPVWNYAGRSVPASGA